MPHAAAHTPSIYSPLLESSYAFVRDQLGVRPAPRDTMQMLDAPYAADFRRAHGLPDSQGGAYGSITGETVILTDGVDPLHAPVLLGARAVHEITHSGTSSAPVGSEVHDEDLFANEALGGMAEYHYLAWQRNKGALAIASGMYLQRAGVELALPGNFRYYNSNVATKGNTSQGLIAALAVAYSYPASGMDNLAILRQGRVGNHTAHRMVADSINTLQRGLFKEVLSYPPTTDGFIQATAAVEAVARKKDIIPPRSR